MHHSKKGYYATFIHIGGKQEGNYCKRIMIHRIVAECWLGTCPEGMEVDHIDRNSLNNDYHNLRYVTKSEQMKNRDHSNISKKGTKNLEEARRKRMKEVTVIGCDYKKHFESLSECSRFLGNKYNESSEKVRYYLRIQAPKYKDVILLYN